MGMFSFLTGKKGGYSGAYKGGVDDVLSRWRALNYDPKRDVAGQMTAYDQALGAQEAAGSRAMRSQGFEGTPYLGAIRSAFAANARAGAEGKSRDFEAQHLMGEAALLERFKDRWYNQGSKGLLGSLGGIAASFMGGGGAAMPPTVMSSGMGGLGGIAAGGFGQPAPAGMGGYAWPWPKEGPGLSYLGY